MSKDKDSNFGKYKYEKGKIYKLCCKDPTITEFYVGSTLNQYKRKNAHKSVCNNPNRSGYNIRLYQFIRDNGGFDNWDLVVLEEYPAENKNELTWKEREWIELLKPVLNSIRPIATTEENREKRRESKKIYCENNREQISEINKIYHENNREQISERKKIYHENNREKIIEYQKIYRENNKEKLSEINKIYHENNREQISERKKIYHENNKEKLSERQKIYYENNREKIIEKSRERVKCDICDKDLVRSYLSNHKKRIHST